MPHRVNCSSLLVEIAEVATVSTEKESPNAREEPRGHSVDTMIARSLLAPYDVSFTAQHMPLMADQSQSAKNLRIDSLVESVTKETRASATTDPTVLSKTRNRYGRSILHNAVRKGDKKAIKTILETTPGLLYQADHRGNHPLHYATSPSVPDAFTIVYMLIMAGALVNALNDRLQSPLLIAVISNKDDDDKVARILLFHNAQPAIKVTKDLMLAQYASSRGLHKIAAAIHEYM